MELSTIELMILSTSIFSNYDSFDQNTIDLLNPNQNSVSAKIQEYYPDIDNKIMHSVSFAFTLYLIYCVNYLK